MGKPATPQESSSRVEKHGADGKLTYLAALFASLLALTLIVMFWVYSPSYVVFLQGLDASSLTTVTAELQKNNIAYRYESGTGEILVPEKSLYHAKFVLGSQGIESGGVSQKLLDVTNNETWNFANQKHPDANFLLESELAKTIASIDNIRWARVHLAIDKTGTATSKNNSRASVFVRLVPGRGLGESQIASIAHLVASSAANLSVENVTIIDQQGGLLKTSGETIPNIESSKQFSFARILEQSYINKIEKLLIPVFGKQSIKVRVDADIEFTGSDNSDSSNSNAKLSHQVKKLTTTVVVDYKYIKGDDGQWISIPRKKADLERVEKLIKDTVDFNEQRGDRIHIFNEAFGNFSKLQDQTSGFLAENSESYYLKVLLIAIFIVVVCYVLLRYLIQKIMEMKPLALAPEARDGDFAVANSDIADSSDLKDSQEEKPVVVSTYEALLSRTRQQVNNNPAQVANVIKSWVRDNGR